MSQELWVGLELVVIVVGAVAGLVLLVRRARIEGERQRFQVEPRVGDLAGYLRKDKKWVVCGFVVEVDLSAGGGPWAKLQMYRSSPNGETTRDTWWRVEELRWFPPGTELGIVEE